MTKNELFERISTILHDTFEIDTARITPESRLYDDLDIDSIDAVDLIVQLKPLLGRNLQPDAFKAVRDNSKGSPDFAALDKAIVVIEKAAKDMGTWFPKGTGTEAGKTRALPEVWTKTADFTAAQKLFAEKVAPLSAAVKAKDGDAVGKAFKEVGGACKNCHDTFRAPE